MTDNERFDQVCQPAFVQNKSDHAEISGKLDAILSILKGANGDPGICERLRNVEKAILPDLTPRLERVESFQKGIIGSVVVIGGAILTQVGAWLWSKIGG